MTKKEIENKIREIKNKQQMYNNVMNEGEEGFVPDFGLEELYVAWGKADKEEFFAEWTLEIFNERRKIYNALGLTIMESIKYKHKDGWTPGDLWRAKEHYLELGLIQEKVA